MPLQSVPHSPLGARASFDFGPPGTAGGFAVPTGNRHRQGVFVGCRHSPTEPWSLLPCYTPTPDGPTPLPKGRYGRFFAAAGDKWMIGPLVFKLCTPFEVQPGNDERFRYAPLVAGYLEYENTHNEEPAELVFGIGSAGQRFAASDATGFVLPIGAGFATPAGAEATAVDTADFLGGSVDAFCGLRFTVPARSRRLHPLVVAFAPRDSFAAHSFNDVAAVLVYGLQEHARYLANADRLDAEFMRSSADYARKTEVAEQLRVWLAESWRGRADPDVDLGGLRALWQSVSSATA